MRLLSSGLEKALENFDKLSEEERAKIAKDIIRGAMEIEGRAKTRGLRKT